MDPRAAAAACPEAEDDRPAACAPPLRKRNVAGVARSTWGNILVLGGSASPLRFVEGSLLVSRFVSGFDKYRFMHVLFFFFFSRALINRARNFNQS